MKRNICFLVVFVLLLGITAIPVSADTTADTIRVEAEFFDQGTFHADYTNQMRMYSGNTATYNVEFNKTGNYEIQIYTGTYATTAHNVTVSVDGVSQGTKSFTPNDSNGNGTNYATYTLGNINIAEIGTHKITFTMGTGCNALVDYFIFTRKSDISMSKKFDTDIAHNTTTTNTTYHYLGVSGEYAEYLVDFPMAGKYEMGVNCGANGQVAIHVYVDDDRENSNTANRQLKEVIVQQTAGGLYENYEDKTLGTLTIPTAGQHKIRIQYSWGAKLTFTSLKFTRTADWSTTINGYADIIAEESKNASSNSNATAGAVMWGDSGDCAVYEINFPAAGTYNLMMNYSGYYGAKITANMNDQEIGSALFPVSAGLGTYADVKVAEITVAQAGSQKIKIIPATQTRIKSLTVTPVSNASAISAVAAWNGANKQVDYTLTNNGSTGDAVLYCAVYTKNDDGSYTLKDIDTKNIEWTDGVAEFSTKTLDYSKRDIVKTYIWDGELTPFGKAQYVMVTNNN